MANTWNQSGTTWNTGRFGTTDAITTGWGADAWNTGGSWGQANDEVAQLTGVSATFSLGTLISGAQQGWGRSQWGEEPWGESNNPVVTLSGQSFTACIGSFSVSAQIAVGWGQDGWGVEDWGESGLTLELTAPDAIQSDIGSETSWGKQTWGSQNNGWSGEYYLVPADVMGLTGVSSTSGVGSISPVIDASFSLTAPSAITSSVGSLDPNDQSMGLTGQAITSGVGVLSPADVEGITGISFTASIGSVTITSNPTIIPTSLSITSAVGSLAPADVMGLTGLTFTASVGSIAPADVMGLTGQSVTSSVAGFGTSDGFGIQAYSAVDTGSNTSYTNVA